MACLRPHYLSTDWTKMMKFDWWVVIDVDYIIAKGFFNFYNLVNLHTFQKWLKFILQIPTAGRENTLVSVTLSTFST